MIPLAPDIDDWAEIVDYLGYTPDAAHFLAGCDDANMELAVRNFTYMTFCEIDEESITGWLWLIERWSADRDLYERERPSPDIIGDQRRSRLARDRVRPRAYLYRGQ